MVVRSLTRDADVPTLKEVLDHLQTTVGDQEELADVAATMAVLADHDPRQRGFGPLIVETLTKELIMQSSIGQHIFGKGLEQGHEQGHEQGLEQGLRPLVHLFERRLGRPLSKVEYAGLRQRLVLLGPEKLGDFVLDVVDPDQLAAWLSDVDHH